MADDLTLPDATGTSPFERLRQTAEDGSAYWSARDLSEVLGYVQWRNFKDALARAVIACTNSGQEPQDHFGETTKMIPTGKGARRRVQDYHLSRYACYLIIQNADPTKEIVALGQTYFAVQTRRQELRDAAALDGLDEAKKRLVLRSELATRNTNLASTAQGSGILTDRDFAIFQGHGYMGLYNGLRAKDIHQHKGLTPTQKIIATWSAAWRTRGGLPVLGADPQGYRIGAVAWAADRAAFQLPDGRLLPFRLTAVFQHEHERWTLVQAHSSFSVPDARAADVGGTAD